MRRLTRSGLVLLALLLGFLEPVRAEGPQPGDRPTILVPLRPQTRDELARREALKLYGLGLMRLHEDRLVDATHLLEEALAQDPEAAPILKALVPLYLALSRMDDALATCRKVLDVDPGDYETWALYAKRLKYDGRLAESRTALERALACKGLADRLDLRVQLAYELGLVCEELKACDPAVAAFREVVKILDNPQHLLDMGGYSADELKDQAAETYERMIKLCIDAKDYERALALFVEGKQKHPVLGRRLNFNLAKVELAQGQPGKALEYVDEFLKTEPRGTEAYELRGTILMQLQREDEILPALEAYHERDARNVALSLLLARQYALSGSWEKGENLYLNLVNDTPTPEAYSGLFTLYRDRLGATGMARILAMLNQAIEKSHKGGKGGDEGDPQFAARARAMLQALRENPSLARGLLPAGQQAVLNNRGRNGSGLQVQTLFFLAVLARREHQLAEAEQFYRNCLENNSGLPQEHLIYSGLLEVLMQGRKYEAIVEICRQGLVNTKATNHVLFYNSLARTLVILGKTEEGLEAADKAVAIAPEDQRFWARRSRVTTLALAQRYPQALAEGQAMLTDFTEPGQVHDVRLMLSTVYSSLREFAKAEEQIQIVLREDPNDAMANNNLGYQWADLGKNLEEAEKLIRKALDLDAQQRKTKAALNIDDDGENAAYVDSLGWILFRRGRLQEARAWLEKATSLAGGQDDPTVWDHLGDVYQRSEETAKARAAWQKALELFELEKQRRDDEHYKELKHKLQLLAN